MKTNTAIGLVLAILPFGGCLGTDAVVAGVDAPVAPAPPLSPITPGDAVLEGVVVNEEQTPIVGVNVGLTDRPAPSTQTDETGAFRLGPLDVGPVKLIFEKSGYRSFIRSVDVSREGSQPVRVTMAAVPVDEPREEIYRLRAYVGLDFRVAGNGCGACGQITEPEKHAQVFEVDTTGDGLRTIIVGSVWTNVWPINSACMRTSASVDGDGLGGETGPSPLTFRVDDVDKELESEARIVTVSEYGAACPGELYYVTFQQPVDIYVNFYYFKNATADYSGIPVE